MKNIYLICCMAALTVIGSSCSQQLQRRYDQRHGTSSGSTDASDRSYDSDYRSNNGTYKRDYDRVLNETPRSDNAVSAGSSDYNQQLIAQYQEMDKLGEVVLYELDNLESRYNVLINEYRTAKSSQKGVLADQLDRISADQLVLYRAYTNIYRNGKTNWASVKRDVENDLRSVRRVADR
ncbi:MULTISPECIES: hypothetical protein [Dyadobacter]|uniref:Uncharacterized protein n=1 Tax=Dyadobacter chenhuakuii TaxID=2909339 RepID=A0ABY4XMV3_9BACT|nr:MULTISPECIES: hypothetical protein [Dyadobacter]MCF2494921.1 hypothetical protein [Dyadobacter chenhuakuii]MCF2518999.1 hypothetical protein [Dyadobacter sp. CY351]USJ31762.1 hypothetical protein NFI80_03280 [Dyadobacter chenhuakuii]